MKHKTGKLYGIGVNPDTIKVRSHHEVDIVFAASSLKNDYSIALKITRPHLNKDIRMIRLSFSMNADIKREKYGGYAR